MKMFLCFLAVAVVAVSGQFTNQNLLGSGTEQLNTDGTTVNIGNPGYAGPLYGGPGLVGPGIVGPGIVGPSIVGPGIVGPGYGYPYPYQQGQSVVQVTNTGTSQNAGAFVNSDSFEG